MNKKLAFIKIGTPILILIILLICFPNSENNEVTNTSYNNIKEETTNEEKEDVVTEEITENSNETNKEIEKNNKIEIESIPGVEKKYMSNSYVIELNKNSIEKESSNAPTEESEEEALPEETTVEEKPINRIVKLEAIFIGTNKQIGYTPSAFDIAVSATYEDGSCKWAEGWYIEDTFKPLVEGNNNITIFYSGIATILTINAQPQIVATSNLLPVQNAFLQDDLNHLIMLVYQEVGNSSPANRRNFISIAFNHYRIRFGGVGRIDRIIKNYDSSGQQWFWLMSGMPCWCGTAPSINTVIAANKYFEILTDINYVYVNGNTVPYNYMISVTTAQYQKWLAVGKVRAGQLIWDGVAWIGPAT